MIDLSLQIQRYCRYTQYNSRKRKQALIYLYKSTDELQVATSGLVEVYSNIGTGKPGKWSTPKTLLEVNAPERNALISYIRGKFVTVSFEDTRHAPPDQSFANNLQSAIYSGNDIIDDVLPSTKEDNKEQADKYGVHATRLSLTHEDACFYDQRTRETSIHLL